MAFEFDFDEGNSDTSFRSEGRSAKKVQYSVSKSNDKMIFCHHLSINDRRLITVKYRARDWRKIGIRGRR